MRLDVENVAKNRKKWRPMYEVIDTFFFAATKIFLPEFLDQCKKIQMNISSYNLKEKWL